MKKNLLPVLLLCAAGSLAAENFIIDGNNPAISDGSAIILYLFDGRVGSSIAIDTVHGGKFHLEAEVPEGISETQLSCDEPGFPPVWRDIKATPGAHISIEATDKLIRTWPLTGAIPEQELLDNFLYNSSTLWNEYQQSFVDFHTAISDTTLTDEARAALKKTAKKETARRDSIYDVITERDIDLLASLPHSPQWLDKFADLAQVTSFPSTDPRHAEALKKLHSTLSSDELATEAGQTITAYLFPPDPVKPGSPLVDADLYDLEGNIHHLSELKGRWILIDFWSRGCYPCVMSLPELAEVAEANKEKVAVVSISSDPEEGWRQASEDHNITWYNWSDKKMDIGIYQAYGINAIPTFVVIDPDGIVRNFSSGYTFGFFSRLMRPFIDPKPAMAIHKDGAATIVSYPDSENNTTDGILEVSSIELSPEATKIHFNVYYTPGYWIKISGQSTLIADDGQTYPLLSTEGITADKEFYTDSEGRGSFTLSFGPIPETSTSITFREGGADSRWSITGLRLK